MDALPIRYRALALLAVLAVCAGVSLLRCGLPETHFHDLRHTGNVLTASAGASLRELMNRIGHSSPPAALIYLHGSDERQRVIADSVSNLAERERAEGVSVPLRG